MKSYFKVSLALVASLVLLLGCSKQASTPINSSSKEDTTTQSSESKQSSQQSSEKKETTKTHTFVNKNNSGITSTLVYTVEGDNVIKQSANNIADPEILQKMSRVLSKKSTKVIMDSKVLNKRLKSKMEKLFKI